jgi:hypothetical protein
MEIEMKSSVVLHPHDRFIRSPYKAFDLNDSTSTARMKVNREGDFLQLAGTFRW